VKSRRSEALLVAAATAEDPQEAEILRLLGESLGLRALGDRDGAEKLFDDVQQRFDVNQIVEVEERHLVALGWQVVYSRGPPPAGFKAGLIFLTWRPPVVLGGDQEH
jgi:hypothetical protein